jgi:hypothetical protein
MWEYGPGKARPSILHFAGKSEKQLGKYYQPLAKALLRRVGEDGAAELRTRPLRVGNRTMTYDQLCTKLA